MLLLYYLFKIPAPVVAIVYIQMFYLMRLNTISVSFYQIDPAATADAFLLIIASLIDVSKRKYVKFRNANVLT